MINREALLEAMAHEIEFSKKTGMPLFTAGLAQAVEIIKNQDEVPSIPVIHCKDCRFWVDYSKSTARVKKCEKGGYAIGDKGYCVYGEKKA